MHKKAFFSLADMIVEYADDGWRVSDLASQPVVNECKDQPCECVAFVVCYSALREEVQM